MEKRVPDRVHRVLRTAELREQRLFDKLGLRPVRDRLEESYRAWCEEEDRQDFDGCIRFQKARRMMGAEIFFVPDRRYYGRVLSRIPIGSTVLDAGAGDLRFSLALAKRARLVYAVEVNPAVLGRALSTIGYDLPTNVIPVCADVFNWRVPEDVTHIVCIMIHRQHEFPEDWKKRRVVFAHHSRGVIIRPADRQI